MAKISKIGSALAEINEAAFQELCNKFLFYKYDYKNINQKGSVIGKEKTRKGTPDTIFIDKDDKYIFAEYTTKERIGNSKSFFAKIESDVRDCFNPIKTAISNDKVSKVIICHTGNLELHELETLTELCKSYNKNCVFKQFGIDDLSIQLELYPTILYEYLGIKVGTGQIMKLQEYIDFYEKPDLRIATPLSNAFYGREKEIDEGLSSLNNTNLLLVTGASGVGKTKFAIELCQRFISKNASYSLFCFANKNIEANEDLQNYLSTDKDYILLVDDANRAMGNYHFILHLLRSDRKGKIKIVTTVRDYAKDMIEDASLVYNYNALALEIVSDEDIIAILKSEDFNIQNQVYLDKIVLMARGNLRLAIMFAIIARKENTLSSLDDVSQLYELYFKDVYQKIVSVDKNNSLRVLGIISFFRVISKERVDFNNRIFTAFSINEELFWEQCQYLNQLEIVDLYANEIVNISDQILSTYLCYKIFFDEKILDFGILIRDFIDIESKFYDALNPLIVAFNYRNITDEITFILERDWLEITKDGNHKDVLKIGNIFWYFLDNKFLSYFYDYISSLPESENIEFIVDYEHNDMSYSGRCDLLSILSNYKQFGDDRTKSALELMFLFVEKIPEQSKKLSYLLKENWMITRHDYDYGLYAQHILIDFLISKLEDYNEKELYVKMFFKVASCLLETTFRENASVGRKIAMYTININLSDDVKKLRRKIWNFLWILYPQGKKEFHKLLFKLGSYGSRESKDIWAFDYEVVCPYLKNLDYTYYSACEATANYLEKLTRNNIEYDNHIEKVATNKMFELNKLLIARKKKKDWEEETQIQKEKFLFYFKDYTYEDYISFFDDIEILKALDKEKKNDYMRPLSIIFSGIITKDSNMFVEILPYYIEHYSIHLWSSSLLRSYFESNPINNDQLFLNLNRIDSKRAKNWLLEYHHAIPENYLNKKDKELLSNLYTLLSTSKFSMCSIEILIEKYQIYESKEVICDRILGILINNPLLYLERAESLYYLLKHTDDISRCNLIYIKCKRKDEYFDFKNELFLKLLKNDSSFIIEYLDSIYDANKIRYDYYDESFKEIWQLDNYKEIVLIGINYFNTKLFLLSEDTSNLFFQQLGEYDSRALAFIEEMINEYNSDIKYMRVIFNIISHYYPQNKTQFIKQFLSLNQDFDFYSKIVLFPRSMSFFGSWIPTYERRVKDWESILQAVKSLDMGIKLIKHINDIENEISSCKRRIKYEAKRDFLDQLDS